MSASTATIATPEWVRRSNDNAQALLDITSRFRPEEAGFFGVSGLDEQIVDLGPDLDGPLVEAPTRAVETLRPKLAAEKDRLVRQDLEILIRRGELTIESTT